MLKFNTFKEKKSNFNKGENKIQLVFLYIKPT